MRCRITARIPRQLCQRHHHHRDGGQICANTARWLNMTVMSINDGPFEIQAIGDYVGPRFATYTNDQGIGGRYLLNLQAGYSLPRSTDSASRT